MRPELKTLKLKMDKARDYYYTTGIQETDDASIHYKAYMKYIAARAAYNKEFNKKSLLF
tara:strand:+ start:949 stop:1125 length:177 start_codon:yes stop_codon:yes gene_type:complete